MVAHIVTQNAAPIADQYIGNQMIIPVRIKSLRLGLRNKYAQIMEESGSKIDVVIIWIFILLPVAVRFVSVINAVAIIC